MHSLFLLRLCTFVTMYMCHHVHILSSQATIIISHPTPFPSPNQRAFLHDLPEKAWIYL